MKKYYLVMVECGEGVLFDNKVDADFALTGEHQKGEAYSTLADMFRELYGDDVLSMQTIDL